MKIAVEGCCHGELDKIYETVQYIENKDKIKVDLLLICGDFQAVRNRSDLKAMAVPPKFQRMNTFYKYYSGEKKAPVLTIVIGGNHEASNYLQELPYGGWLAPNIYYLGYAGVVQFGGLRIAGLSGIFKARDYNRGHYEHPPYNEETKRSVYHIRNLEVFRLKQCKKDIDIFLSHDWPRGIYNYGNVEALLRRKKFFKEEVNNGTLGNPAAEELLFALKPAHWFSAHLHCKFAAMVQHKANEGAAAKITRFLALDKCLPNRSFLQILDIPHPTDAPMQLELDPEWLCILKSTNHLLSLTKNPTYMPSVGGSDRFDFSVNEEDMKELSADFGGLFKIPENFSRTVESYEPPASKSQLKKNKKEAGDPQIQINPQTSLTCDMLGLTDPFAVFSGKQSHTPPGFQLLAPKMLTDDSDVGLDDDEEDEGVKSESDEEGIPSFIDSTMDTTFETSQEGVFNITTNPDEISLDDIDDDVDDSKSQSDSNMDTSAVSGENATGNSGAETEMNISVTGGNIQVISGADGSLNSSNPSSSMNVPSPIPSFGPQGSSTPQPHRTKLVLNEPMSTPLRSDNMSEGQLLGKRMSDEGCDKEESHDEKTSATSNSGPSKPKKFKRRNQSIYQSSGTEDD